MFHARRAFSLGALCAAIALFAVGGVTASAQAATPFTKKVAIQGTKGFKGTYTIQRFVQSGDRVLAVGTVQGTLRGKKVSRSGVRMPVSLAPSASGAQIPPTPGACQVLSLTIEPIDLNLLGLRVRTSRIDLRIEAIPSTVPGGGLLGDLLCGIANLLNPAANTPLAQVTQLLNALLALSPTGPATGARVH
jgi:hypothetical protein